MLTPIQQFALYATPVLLVTIAIIDYVLSQKKKKEAEKAG